MPPEVSEDQAADPQMRDTEARVHAGTTAGWLAVAACTKERAQLLSGGDA